MRRLAYIAPLAVLCSPAAATDVVFQNINDNGFFTPFNSSNTDVRYGDSGWLTTAGSAPLQLQEITLGLIVFSDTEVAGGTTDLTFTFNDGSPSGLVFGSGAELYSTTVTNVALPGIGEAGSFLPVTVTIPLPSIETLGGFNNVGWSVGVENFSYDGEFGFQTSTSAGQTAGFFTNNASFFDGSSWSLFSFGGDPVTGVANFVTEIRVPAPGSALAIFAAVGVAARRRR